MTLSSLKTYRRLLCTDRDWLVTFKKFGLYRGLLLLLLGLGYGYPMIISTTMFRA
jgi:hypothetical protein